LTYEKSARRSSSDSWPPFFVHFPVEMRMKDYRLTHFAQQFARHTIEARP